MSKSENIENKVKERQSSIKKCDSFIYVENEFNNSIDTALTRYYEQIIENANELLTDKELLPDKVSFEYALTRYHSNIVYISTIIDLFIVKSGEICDLESVSQEVYRLNVFTALFLMWKGDIVAARGFFSLIAQPLLNVNRITVKASIDGGRGGRGNHPDKNQAMLLAEAKWEDEPQLKQFEMVEYLRTALKASSNNHLPSVAALNEWLRTASFKPVKKRQNK